MNLDEWQESRLPMNKRGTLTIHSRLVVQVLGDHNNNDVVLIIIRRSDNLAIALL